MIYDYLGLDSDYTRQEYQTPVIVPQVTNVEGGSVVVTINGASGPNINLVFTNGLTATGGPSGTINITGITNIAGGGTGASTATGARTNLNAAQSGANGDINTFNALAGSGGWAAWTGGSDKTAHATFSGTASVGYVQAELQAVMDKLKEQTEAFKSLLDTLLASGVIKL